MKHITLNQRPRQKTRKNHRMKRLFASIVVTGAVVGGMLLGTDGLSVALSTLDVDATSLYYELTITHEEDDFVPDSLIMVLESEFDDVTIPLVLGFQTGTVADLQPNTAYTLRIIVTAGNDTKTLLTRTFTTQALAQ